MQTSNTESGIVSILEVKLDTQTHKETHMSTKRTGKKHKHDVEFTCSDFTVCVFTAADPSAANEGQLAFGQAVHIGQSVC